MNFHVYIEEDASGWARAHIPALPGCTAVGSDRDAAVGALPEAVSRYREWLGQHGLAPALSIGGEPDQFVVQEVVGGYWSIRSGETGGNFRHDMETLPADELKTYIRLLELARADLVALVAPLPEEVWDFRHEETTLQGVVTEARERERWLLSRLEDPSNPVTHLQSAHQLAVGGLKGLTAALRARAVNLEGEVWTARKVLRQLIWYELQRLDQVRNLVDAYNGTHGTDH